MKQYDFTAKRSCETNLMHFFIFNLYLAYQDRWIDFFKAFDLALHLTLI